MSAITRADLKHMPSETTTIILDIQKQGWEVSLQSNGHVALQAPDGVTRLTVSRNPNSAKYLLEDLSRYASSTVVVPKEKPVSSVRFSCPRPGCNRTYLTLEQLNHHIGVDHEKLLPCPECGELFPRPTTLGWHRSKEHGYVSPNREARRAQEARAKQRKATQATQVTKVTLPVVEEEPAQQETNVHIVLDERDSWVVDTSTVEHKTISTLLKYYSAAGLGMELRVWRK